RLELLFRKEFIGELESGFTIELGPRLQCLTSVGVCINEHPRFCAHRSLSMYVHKFLDRSARLNPRYLSNQESFNPVASRLRNPRHYLAYETVRVTGRC